MITKFESRSIVVNFPCVFFCDCAEMAVKIKRVRYDTGPSPHEPTHEDGPSHVVEEEPEKTRMFVNT